MKMKEFGPPAEGGVPGAPPRIRQWLRVFNAGIKIYDWVKMKADTDMPSLTCKTTNVKTKNPAENDVQPFEPKQ